MKNFTAAAQGNYQLQKALTELSVATNGIPAVTGNIYYVIPSSDSNYVEFFNKYQKTYEDGSQAVHNTIASAYSKVVSNRNDVIMLSSNAAHAQTSMLTIAKNRVHFVAMSMRGGSFGMGARARVTMGVTTSASDLAVLKNTGIGNTFRGIKFDSSNTKDESLYSVVEAGEYAVYESCEFYKSTDLDQNLAAEVLNNGDSAQWIKCVFGSSANETVGAVIRPCMLLSATIAGAKCRDNIIDNCIFLTKSANTARVDIYGANATDVERMLLIKDSVFLSNILGSATPAHAVGFGAAQTEGTVILKNCTSIDHTVMKQASRSIYVDGAVPTQNTSGVAVTG